MTTLTELPKITFLEPLLQNPFESITRTHYHEAGHAVAAYILGLNPTRITGSMCQLDGRSVAFLRRKGGLLQTPLARQRAIGYIVMCLAGPASESTYRGHTLADLRSEIDDYVEAGEDNMTDYGKVLGLINCISLHSAGEISQAVRTARLERCEQMAITLMAQPNVWAAVESVVDALGRGYGQLDRDKLVAAINRGLLPDRVIGLLSEFESQSLALAQEAQTTEMWHLEGSQVND